MARLLELAQVARGDGGLAFPSRRDAWLSSRRATSSMHSKPNCSSVLTCFARGSSSFPTAFQSIFFNSKHGYWRPNVS
ncbi:hypothetical protein LCGC14_1931580 [marine sediment metagenome]|uniref:Uncharacterized protein n=1 Tax=marine sediment metagenome TaxID=412755 RepID=A0A0F9GBB7_9ZZZZ